MVKMDWVEPPRGGGGVGENEAVLWSQKVVGSKP